MHVHKPNVFHTSLSCAGLRFTLKCRPGPLEMGPPHVRVIGPLAHLATLAEESRKITTPAATQAAGIAWNKLGQCCVVQVLSMISRQEY